MRPSATIPIARFWSSTVTPGPRAVIGTVEVEGTPPNGRKDFLDQIRSRSDASLSAAPDHGRAGEIRAAATPEIPLPGRRLLPGAAIDGFDPRRSHGDAAGRSGGDDRLRGRSAAEGETIGPRADRPRSLGRRGSDRGCHPAHSRVSQSAGTLEGRRHGFT